MKKVLSLVLVLALLLTTSIIMVSAEVSPTKETEADYHIVVDHSGDGTADADHYDVQIGSEGEVTLTATDGDQSFDHWVLDGDYEIIEGSLNSRYLKIRPHSNIHATAIFDSGTNGKKDKSDTSPKTGTLPYALALVFIAGIAGAAIIIISKKVKKHN